jgi:tetratricopeptide (TPR) repeat protein
VALMPPAAIDEAARACAAGDCVESIDLLEDAVRLRPGDFRLHYRLGQCYSGCCRSHPLVDPDMAVPYLRQALRFLGSGPGIARAAVLDQLGNTLTRRGAWRDAIDCHLAAAEMYRSFGMPGEWARAQFNLGNSYCELAEATGENHWEEAASHYEKSLEVRSRQKDPEHYAATLENLGTAYRRLAGLKVAGSITKSIQCYRRALWIYIPAANSNKCAAVHNNLGNAYLSLPGDRNTRRALRHFDRALRLQSQEKERRTYGITQFNRAQAYLRLAQSSLAVSCLREASRAFQSCGEDRYTQLIRAQLEGIGLRPPE